MRERKRVIEFAKSTPSPLVNTKIENYSTLLNPNPYSKGSWLLHMLRKELGDELFLKCLKAYYDKFQYGNALSEDFQKVVEEVSKKDFSTFFKQWLYFTGHPQLVVNWSYKKQGFLEVEIEQLQKDFEFNFPLDIKMVYKDELQELKTIHVKDKIQKFRIQVPNKVKSIEIDPNAWLLFELEELKKG